MSQPLDDMVHHLVGTDKLAATTTEPKNASGKQAASPVIRHVLPGRGASKNHDALDAMAAHVFNPLQGTLGDGDKDVVPIANNVAQRNLQVDSKA